MAVLPAVAASATAQVPASPVLQNAFISPGLGLAANVAGGASESFGGAAVGWGWGIGGVLPSGGLMISGAAGAQRINGSNRGGYGGRLAASMSTDPSRPSAFGAGAFVGVGGAHRTRLDGFVNNPKMVTVPTGVTLGYRRMLGTSRAVSAYVSPMWRWTHWDEGAGFAFSTGRFRVGLGLDFAFSPSFGLTFGGEMGQVLGPSTYAAPGVVGGAISFAPRRS
ncbi:MAG TPA: hypothetical protein VFT29_05475 [Gemmatimonadaceae bacterium]|nr:hypothetical protein [Gemmatimonadaceae bacterium]